MRFIRALSAGAALVAVTYGAAPLSAQTDIDTTPSWDGTSFWAPFGIPNIVRFGQTFTITSATTINSFEFWTSNTQNLEYRGVLMGWTGLKASGLELFSSGTISGAEGTNHHTFSTGGMGIGAGMYVAFLEATGLDGAEVATGGVGGSATDNPYAGGTFVYQNAPATPTGTNWGVINTDLAFRADFGEPAVVTPEPVTMTLLGTGLAGVVAARRRRKQASV